MTKKMENSRKMEYDTGSLSHEKRYPTTRNDQRGTLSRYYWLPNVIPFEEIVRITQPAPNKKKKKKKNALYAFLGDRAEGYKTALNILSFNQTVAGITGINVVNLKPAHFIDEKQNYWFMTLNILDNDTTDINNKLKYNFELNKEKGHTKIELLQTTCDSEFFLYFSNKLWDINIEPEAKNL